MTTIVTLGDRPDLAPIITEWIWQEWSRHDGYTFEQTLEYIEASSARQDIPQTFVLLVDGEPVGTSSLVAADMKERPDLTPWMASVFVIPAARRQGHVIPLIQAVEAAAVAAGGTVQSLGGSGHHRNLLRWFVCRIEQTAKSGSERAIVDRATNLKNGISATP